MLKARDSKVTANYTYLKRTQVFSGQLTATGQWRNYSYLCSLQTHSLLCICDADEQSI